MIPYITKHSLRPKQRKKKNPPKGSFPVIVEGDEISMLPRSSSSRCHRRPHNHRLMMMMKGGHGNRSCYSLSRPSISSLKSSFSATATKIKKTCVHVPVVIGSSIHKKLGGIASAPRMLGVGSTTLTPYQLSSSSSYSSTSTTSFSESSSWKTSTCSKNQAGSPSSFFFSSFGKAKKEGEIEVDDDDYDGAVVDDTMKLVDYMDDDGSGSSSEDYEHQYEYQQQHEYHHQEFFLNAEDMNEI
mmetsp:Transcript_31443/g.76096  ORF Transcript_31443/g.76096 Transcript_31443/m.76096 type:complete len:242 (+) Transcript_31443:2173-2898(+)